MINVAVSAAAAAAAVDTCCRHCPLCATTVMTVKSLLNTLVISVICLVGFVSAQDACSQQCTAIRPAYTLIDLYPNNDTTTIQSQIFNAGAHSLLCFHPGSYFLSSSITLPSYAYAFACQPNVFYSSYGNTTLTNHIVFGAETISYFTLDGFVFDSSNGQYRLVVCNKLCSTSHQHYDH